MNTPRERKALARIKAHDAARAQEIARIKAHDAARAHDDHAFYEKKERFLGQVEAGTATQEQKEWLLRWGFLEKPKPLPLKPTYDTPTKTGRAYRYRGPKRVTPSSKFEVSSNRPTDRKSRRSSRSVWSKSQTMRS